jgi:CO/xanthine dehydrogenase Mo-binding subunit
MARTVRQEMRGKSDFTSDIYIRNMRYAAVVRSAYARASVQSIDCSELPESVVCITARDVPGENELRIGSETIPVLAENESNYVGEAVALLGGRSQREIVAALGSVDVEYDELAPALAFTHPHDKQIQRSFSGQRGRPEKLMKSAVSVVEGSYRTGAQEHLYNEPQGAVAEPAGSGTFVIRCATQWPFHVRQTVAAVLGIAEELVIVRSTDPGVALDGKLWFPSLVAARAALVANAMHAPVKLVYSNVEDYRFTTKRAPFFFHISSGIDEAGTINSLKVDGIYNAGAYPLFTREIASQVIAALFTPYRCEDARITVSATRTNLPPMNVMSGFGAASACFATETHVARLAELAQTDPIVWRKENLAGQPVGAKNRARSRIESRRKRFLSILDHIAEASDFSRKYAAYELQKKRRDEFTGLRRPTRGIGVAIATHGAGFIDPDPKFNGAVTVRLESDGTAVVRTSAVPASPSVIQGWKRIVAEILELETSEVAIRNEATDQVPDSGPGTLSRHAAVLGRLIEQASISIQKQRFRKPLPLEVRRAGKANNNYQIDSLSGEAFPEVTVGAAVVEVTVDPVTFESTVERLWITADAGRIMDANEAKRALEMSIHQALEWSTHELVTYRAGAIDPRSYLAYRNVTEPILPEITVELLESTVKQPLGLGDLPQNCVPAALTSAVSQATGRYMDQIPTNPALIHGYMESE